MQLLLNIHNSDMENCKKITKLRTIWTLLKDAVLYQVRVSNWDNVARRESRIFFITVDVFMAFI